MFWVQKIIIFILFFAFLKFFSVLFYRSTFFKKRSIPFSWEYPSKTRKLITIRLNPSSSIVLAKVSVYTCIRNILCSVILHHGYMGIWGEMITN